MKIGEAQSAHVNSDLQQVKELNTKPEELETQRKEEEVTGLSADEKQQNRVVSTINTEVQKTQDAVLRQQLEQEEDNSTQEVNQALNAINPGVEEEQGAEDSNRNSSGVLDNKELLNSDSVSAIQSAGNIDLRG